MREQLAHPDTEYALLARLLVEPDSIPDVIGQLDAEDFSSPSFGDVYALLVSRHLDNKATDAVLILAETGVDFDPMELPVGSNAPISQYVELIKDASTRRSLMAIFDDARHRIATSAADPLAIVEAAVERVVSRQRSSLTAPKEQVERYAASFAKRKETGIGLTYGLSGVDSILLPAHPGRLVMLAARPSMGKTALAETIADHWALSGPVLFASFEMQADELLDRAMARHSGIPVEDIIRARVEIGDLQGAMSMREGLPIYYMPDRNAGTTAAIRAEANRIKLANGGALAAIVIDYLQLLADKEGGDNEVYRIGNISHATKRLATSMGCPVLALVQFSRAIEQSDKPRAPRLSDMRDSGILEQDADVVMAMVGNLDSDVRELHVLKQRQGRLGRVVLYFDGSVQRWRESDDVLAW